MMASSYKDVLSYLENGGLDDNAQQMVEDLIEAKVRPTREEAYSLIADWAIGDCTDDIAMLATEPFSGDELPEVIACSPSGTGDSVILAQVAKGGAYTGDELLEIAAYAEDKRVVEALAAAAIAKGRRLDGKTVSEIAFDLGADASNDALAALCVVAPTYEWDDGYWLCSELCARGMPATGRVVKDKVRGCEPWERQLIADEFLTAPAERAGKAGPVAATLLQVKQPSGVLSTIGFAMMGESAAGTPGAFAGLLLSDVVSQGRFNAKWSVLFSDGTRKTLRTNESDSRSWEYDALPSVEEYEALHPQFAEGAKAPIPGGPIPGGGMTTVDEAREWAAGVVENVRREFAQTTGIDVYGPPRAEDRVELVP